MLNTYKTIMHTVHIHTHTYKHKIFCRIFAYTYAEFELMQINPPPLPPPLSYFGFCSPWYTTLNGYDM